MLSVMLLRYVSYLYGTLKEGEDGYVFWGGSTGSRKVILRKVGKDESGNVTDVALSVSVKT